MTDSFTVLLLVLAIYGAVAIFRDIARLQDRGSILRAKHLRYIEDLRKRGTYEFVEEWLTDYPLLSSDLYFVEFTRGGKKGVAFFSERSNAESLLKDADETGKRPVLRLVTEIMK